MTNKIKLGLVGPSSSPKLFSALQIAYGLCGAWERILVIGASTKDTQYQHMGAYNTLFIPADAPPQRYMELLNLGGSCMKEVIIFSSFSQEWIEGVTRHLSASYYEELLRSHRSLLRMIHQFPRHIIACMDSRKKLAYQGEDGKLRLHLSSQVLQQEGVERHFTTMLSLDKKGRAMTVKDLTQTLPTERPFSLTAQVGAMLQDWCCQGTPLVPKELQQRINQCNTLAERYQLLFEQDMDDEELYQAFCRRRLELENAISDQEGELRLSQLHSVTGGRL